MRIYETQKNIYNIKIDTSQRYQFFYKIRQFWEKGLTLVKNQDIL